MKRRFTKYPSNYVRASRFVYDEMPIATDGDWEMWAPATHEVAMHLAKTGGSWARWTPTSSNARAFDFYMSKGPLYLFRNKSTGEKYLSHPATNEWFVDENDMVLSKEDLAQFLDEHPKFIIREFADLLREWGRNGFSFKEEGGNDGENPGWFLSDRR